MTKIELKDIDVLKRRVCKGEQDSRATVKLTLHRCKTIKVIVYENVNKHANITKCI